MEFAQGLIKAGNLDFYVMSDEPSARGEYEAFVIRSGGKLIKDLPRQDTS